MSCLFGSLDVVWAASWLDWIAASGCIADLVVVCWEWYRSPPRTGSHGDRRKLPKLLDFEALLQTPSARQKSAVRCPTPVVAACPKSVTNSKSLEELTSGCAISRPARWQRGGQRNQRRKRAITCAEVRTGDFWTTTPPPAHSGGSSDVSGWKVGRIAPEAKSCEGTHSATESSNRSWQVPQVCKGARSLWSMTSSR